MSDIDFMDFSHTPDQAFARWYYSKFNRMPNINKYERDHDRYEAWQAAKQTDVVPGVMACDKCKFSLIRTNLYVNTGTVGAGDNEPEPCPNGCGQLISVTWKQYAGEQAAIAERFFEEVQDLKKDSARLDYITKGNWQFRRMERLENGSQNFTDGGVFWANVNEDARKVIDRQMNLDPIQPVKVKPS